jgi:ubiquinone/menaquinone biosynthesis C-methylase UbiE
MASRWDERIEPDSPEHLAPLAAACDQLPAEPQQILELGTGTGAGARFLAGRFPNSRVKAVDISPAMVETARAQLPPELAERVTFAEGDAGSLPDPDASFDLVAQLNLPARVDEIARLVRPGGHVAVASSRGPATPYYTPETLLRRRFERLGFRDLRDGRAGSGTYFVAGR